MMGVGKTTLGKLVAKNQGLEFIDTDANIENKNSMTINEIFEQKGENFFRLEEKKEILNLLSKQDCVIALGGGAFMDKTIRESVLKNAISVWLDIDLKILNQRLKWNQKRPLLKKYNNQKKLNELYEQRKNIYQLANHKIVCDKLNKEDIANFIELISKKYKGEIFTHKRGVQTEEQLKYLSTWLQKDPKQLQKTLLSLRPGQTLNAEYMYAARELLAAGMNKLDNMAQADIDRQKADKCEIVDEFYPDNQL